MTIDRHGLDTVIRLAEDHERMLKQYTSAADIQAPAVRQSRTWLYVGAEFEKEFASALDAKVVDPGENLVVLIPDDGGVFYRVDTGANRAPCTNPVQTYVDLAKVGGRGEEAAEAIFNQRLKPAWAGTR